VNYRSFNVARKYIHNIELKSQKEWFEYTKSGKKPADIPSNANVTYKKYWKGYDDWLGYEGTWTINNVKELLQDLIKSKIIYQWEEAVLYSFLLRKGVLSLENNRHRQFFKNLIEATRTEKGRKAKVMELSSQGYNQSDRHSQDIADKPANSQQRYSIPKTISKEQYYKVHRPRATI
jgi:hypothetical protein